VTPTQPLTPRRFAVHYQLSFPYMDDDVTGMDEEYLASDFYDPTGTS
jgi:hypothetical protein